MATIKVTAKELAVELEKLFGKDEQYTLYYSRYRPYSYSHGKNTRKFQLEMSVSKNRVLTDEENDAWLASQAAINVSKRRKQYEALKAEFGS